MNKQKRVGAIHDISCFGKCSLTVAIPIISATGIEVSVLPTALLSTHTGIKNYTYKDLTNNLIPTAKHWKSLDINFNALYSGFLGSSNQIDIVLQIFEMFKTENNLIVVDPVMADQGKLYSIYDNDFPQKMKKLAKKADILMPNITEAVLLTDEKYYEGPYDKKFTQKLLYKLASLGPNKIILTGVYFDNKEIGVAIFDKNTNKIDYVFSNKINGYYPGTGDIFASSLLACFLKGKNLVDSAKIAVEFTFEAIKRTYNAKTNAKFGVNFEEGLNKFINKLS